MNTATGAVAAHVYRVADGAGDTPYAITVTAFDGTNTASCQMPLKVFDPSGTNGFSTTCVNNSSVGSGCPSGAAAVTQLNYATALSNYLGNGKRVLFKCGDTFTGGGANISAVGASIGAYGGCEGTTSNRPILQKSSSGNLINVAATAGDLRIADLAIDGSSYSGSGITTIGDGGALNSNLPYQVTILNVGGSNMCQYFAWVGPQWALVNSTYSTQPANCIGAFANYAGEPFTNGTIPNIYYTAIMGNGFDGGAATSSTYEVVRVSYMRQGVIENNTLLNAGPSYAVLKLHQANTNNSSPTWVGYYSELNVISDNHFGGKSGANLVEVSPQNAQDDERLRNIVIERNVFNGTTGGGRQIAISGQYIAFRNNILIPPTYGAQVAQRGIEPAPQYVEAYNNTCYKAGSATCILFNDTSFYGGSGTATQPSNCTAKNNLAYFTGGGTVVNDAGTSDTVSNNTSTVTSNPGFTNGSGTLSITSDFKPTANYSGGTSVPSWYDALGTAWSATWDLGAVHH